VYKFFLPLTLQFYKSALYIGTAGRQYFEDLPSLSGTLLLQWPINQIKCLHYTNNQHEICAAQKCTDSGNHVLCYIQGCGRLKTPFEHATKVCSKYRERVRRLSGFGMQISPAARKISFISLFIIYLQIIMIRNKNI
jgi:hypothetical protein